MERSETRSLEIKEFVPSRASPLIIPPIDQTRGWEASTSSQKSGWLDVELCKIVRLEDVAIMTDIGVLPYQPDDLANGYLRIYDRKALDEAKSIYFKGQKVRAYRVSREVLGFHEYTVSWDDETWILIGPDNDPMRPLSVECLGDAILE